MLYSLRLTTRPNCAVFITEYKFILLVKAFRLLLAVTIMVFLALDKAHILLDHGLTLTKLSLVIICLKSIVCFKTLIVQLRFFHHFSLIA